MNRPKIIWKLVFSVAFLVVVIVSLVFIQGEYFTQTEISKEIPVAYIDVTDEKPEFATNEAFAYSDAPILENSESIATKSNFLSGIFGINNLSKSQMIITQIVLAFVCLVVATQFQVETSYYEYLNRDQNGMVLFEDKSSELTHTITIYTGFIFKLVGITCVFLALLNYIF